MPIFEYKCEKCNKMYEFVRSFKDSTESIKCVCGSMAHKTISSCSHNIKGYCYKNEYPKEVKE